MYGSYVQEYDVAAIPPPELTQGNSSNDFTTNFSSFMGGNVDFDMVIIYSFLIYMLIFKTGYLFLYLS